MWANLTSRVKTGDHARIVDHSSNKSAARYPASLARSNQSHAGESTQPRQNDLAALFEGSCHAHSISHCVEPVEED
jgi:hypothetical protein